MRVRHSGTLAPLLEAFFTERLMRQRRASTHTMAAYRDSFRLFLTWANRRLRKPPSSIMLEDIDAPLVSAFLDHLERERGIPLARAMRDWRRSTRSFSTRRSGRLPRAAAFSACWRFRQSVSSARSSTPWRLRRSTHCLQRLMRKRGSVDETTRCSSLRYRPDFEPRR